MNNIDLLWDDFKEHFAFKKEEYTKQIVKAVIIESFDFISFLHSIKIQERILFIFILFSSIIIIKYSKKIIL